MENDLIVIEGPNRGGLLKAGETVDRKRPEEKQILMFPSDWSQLMVGPVEALALVVLASL